jgi:indolepyruvate decarboxylase
MNLAESLLHALKAHGAGEIFGIPGDFALPYFKVIEESRILPLYTLSHEPAVGFAADASGRFRKGLGVAAVTYGAGAFNLVNAVAGAYAERSPLVVLSGAPAAAERTSGLGLHHQARTIDTQFRVFQEITCDQAILDDAATAPAEIARVLRSCRERSKPVYIEIPRDMAGAPCGPVTMLPPSPVDSDAIDACADEILARLRGARSPVLMVGVEVRRYGLEDEAAALARRLGLPVVTSFMGRGLLVDSDAPLLGTYLGMAGKPEITELVEQSDALFLLGVILSDTNFGVSAKQIDLRGTIQALEGEVRIGHHVYPRIPIGVLVDRLLAKAGSNWPPRAAPAEIEIVSGLTADAGPIAPTDIARAVNDAMAKHGDMIVATDMGDCLFTAMDFRHTPMVAPGYYAGMGFGVPAGLGIQAASGERPLIAVGDGAFQMTGWELGNCRRYGWDPVVLVFNNASWEMLRVFQPESRFNDLDDWHFADIAASLGGVGERVTTRAELAVALDRALTTRGRFYLIEIMLPRGKMSETLTRFIAGVKRLKDRKGS